jgi:hypothetical protein
MDNQLINKYIRELDDEIQEVRINAIRQLGDMGHYNLRDSKTQYLLK